MTDEQIFKLAITCGLDEFVGEMDDETNGRYWEGWDEQLLKFAREMYDKGREYESELYVDENY
jgi:hypothetical protein